MNLDRNRSSKALWIWNPARLLLDETERRGFFEFCSAHDFEQLWMQIIYTRDPKDGISVVPHKNVLGPDIRPSFKYPNETHNFLREAHEQGFKIEALDGYPEYVQDEFHHIPLSIIDAVIEFNDSGDPAERYDGIHFDNEPYLLIGWHDPKRRKQILSQYLSLNVKCQNQVRQYSQMIFCVDIPFWFNKSYHLGDFDRNSDAYDHKKHQSVAYHILDNIDCVGIMNYRDKAHGSDGLIAHGKALTNYANKLNHGKIYIGVETYFVPRSPVWFALGLPQKYFGKALNEATNQISNLSRLNGLRMLVLNDSKNIHVGIELPSAQSLDPPVDIVETLSLIADKFGVKSLFDQNNKIDKIKLESQAGVEANDEFQNYLEKEISGPERAYPGFIATRIMLPKVTFADDGYDQLIEQITLADEFFKEQPSYVGIAIHYYDSFRKMVDSK